MHITTYMHTHEKRRKLQTVRPPEAWKCSSVGRVLASHTQSPGLDPNITLKQKKPQLDTVGICLQCQHAEVHTEGQEVQSSLATQRVRTQLGIHDVMSKNKLRIRDSSAGKGTYCQDRCLEFDHGTQRWKEKTNSSKLLHT